MDLGQLRQIFRATLGRGHFDEIRAQLPPIYAEHWRRIWELFALGDGDLVRYCQDRNLSVSTFYCLKAAALKHLALDGLEHVYLADFAQKFGDKLELQRHRYFAGKFAQDLQRLKECAPYHQPLPSPKVSQRQSLKGLPPDWRERLADALPEKWRPAYYLLAATGCRPDELSKWVLISCSEASVVVRISGAKVDEQKGQPWREQTLALTSLFADRLQAGAVFLAKKDYPAFRKAFNRAARKLWPRRKEIPAPYALRHQFAADAKAAGVSYETLAQALGHSVTRTQQLYGHSKQGTGRVHLISANTPRAIRQTHHISDPSQDVNASCL